jgi:hypothetical protein
MLKNNIIVLLLASLIFLPLGIITGSLLCKWNIIGDDFFKFTLTDVLTIMVTIGIGVFISFFLSRRTSNDFRRREILLEMINKYQKSVEKMYYVGSKYMDKQDLPSQRDVISCVKMVGINFSTLKNIIAQCQISSVEEVPRRIFRHYYSLKIVLTDTPFGQQGVAYSVAKKIQYEQQYQALINELYILKYNLFS